jgi:hypothetical protein
LHLAGLMADSTSLAVVLAVGLALVLAIMLVPALWRNGSRRRNERLRERFGPEYDVAVEQYGEARAARILEAREERVSKLPLRSLPPSERASFAQSWLLVQHEFVNSPHVAVKNAHELVQRTMHARGYPVDDFNQCVADLSVDYGEIVQNYRAAHALDQANRAGEANTEQLRQALVHYRALFEELLGTPQGKIPPASQRYQPAIDMAHEHQMQEQGHEHPLHEHGHEHGGEPRQVALPR